MNALEELLSDLKDVCAGLVDKRQGQTCRYTMADIGLAAFSVFFMQSPSFLAHQRTLAAGHGRSNCQTLLGMSAIPSDNHIRQMLDGNTPAAFDGLFVTAVEAVAAGGWAVDVPAPGRAGADRARWHRALLLAQDRLPAVLAPPPLGRRCGVFPRLPRGEPGGAGPHPGPAADAGVPHAAGRGGEAGLRARRRQALVGPAWRRPCRLAAGLSRR